MDLGLRDKCVVVTGGSKGIGRAIAVGFALEGARVAICARGEEALRATENEIGALGGSVLATTCDLAEPRELDCFLEEVRARLGRIDVLINNASAFAMSDDETGWQASLNVDLMAAVRAVWRVVPWMTEGGGGSIIHISSISGLEAGSPPSYAAAKAALISHSKTLAVSLAPRKIRVNVVAPGAILFPGGGWDRMSNLNPAFFNAIRDNIPWGRMGTPEEVANVVIFLASEKASWMTGTVVSVDGGQHKANL